MMKLKEGFREAAEAFNQKCSLKKNVSKNFAKFTRKLLFHGLFFHKVEGLSLKLYQKRTLFYRTPLVDASKGKYDNRVLVQNGALNVSLEKMM